nr:unnamed protein product [Callosobruchus chinensis]
MVACEDYTYLGAKISKEGSSKKEISHRINQATYAISRLNTLLWSNNLSKQNKLRIYQSNVQSILLYGKRQNGTDKDWKQIKNEENQTAVTEEIQRRRLKWYGHVNRMCESRWPKKILDWKPPFRRKRGRPPEEWDKQVKKDMLRRDMSDHDNINVIDPSILQNLWRLFIITNQFGECDKLMNIKLTV